MPRNARFRRRPNNTGTVVKLSGKRRKPYCARIMSDERDIITGKKKQVSIGTFETKEEALNALSIYSLTKSRKMSRDEADAVAPDLYDRIMDATRRKVPTFLEIFEIISKEDLSSLSVSARRGYKAWIKRFSSIHDRRIDTITLADLQDIFDRDGSANGTQVHMKALCSKIFEYAVIHQYISRDSDYTSYIRVAGFSQSDKHYPFSIDEIRRLKELDTPEAHLILIYIYTGCRASELIGISRDAVHIDEACSDDGNEMTISYLVAGSKTEAGRNRVIPIHDDIKGYVVEELLKEGNRLIDCSYSRLSKMLASVNDALGTSHTMHDTRKTFASLCQLNSVNIYVRKKVLGHKMNDITFDVYTNESKNVLYREINSMRI